MFRTVIVWVFVLLLEIVVVFALSPAESVARLSQDEYQLISNELGPLRAYSVTSRANSQFSSALIDTGIVAESFHLFVPTRDERDASQHLQMLGHGVFAYVSDRLTVLWSIVFQGFVRMQMFSLWLPVMLPLIVASSVDAYFVRRVKLISFSMFSAPVYGASLRSLVMLVFLPCLYAILPLAVTPLFVPAWYLWAAAAMWGLLSNMQRM